MPLRTSLRVAHDVEAGDARAARGRRQHRRQHFDQRALAGAVGADQAEDFPRANRETHVADDDAIAEGARQPLDRYGRANRRRVVDDRLLGRRHRGFLARAPASTARGAFAPELNERPPQIKRAARDPSGSALYGRSMVETSDCVPSRQAICKWIALVLGGAFRKSSAFCGTLNGSLASHAGRSKRCSGAPSSSP